MADKTRTFNGLYYDHKHAYLAKYEATARAKAIRASGYGARIVKTKAKVSGSTLYRVYQSRRKMR